MATDIHSKLLGPIVYCKNAVHVLEKQMRKDFANILEEELVVLKSKYPNLDSIFIIGSTPDWNDGEECTHESDVYIENTIGDGWTQVTEYFDRINGYDSDETSEEVKKINSNLSDVEIDEINEFISSFLLEDLLESVYETNYNITIDFSGDNVKVKYESYDCGY